MGTRTKAIVIGAGIGGLTTAIALRRAGVEVEVFERAQELKERGSALGLTGNAVAALRLLGIHGKLEAKGAVLEIFRILDWRGRRIADVPVKQVQEELGIATVSLHRAALQSVLLEAAEGCKIHLGAKCERFESTPDSVRAYFSDGRTAEADVLIGADGLYSVIRKQIVGPEEPRYGGYVCWLSTIPYAHPRLTKGYAGFYWGHGTRFGLIDIGHGQAYWWGTQNRRRRIDPLEAAASIKRNVGECFVDYPEEVRGAIAATPETAIVQIDALDRPFLERWGAGRTTLLGDAAHPMLTSLAQGACMAIEDGAVLGRCLAQTADPVAALRQYERLRLKRTRQMTQMSRVLAAIEQFEHPVAVTLRNTYFRLVRQSMHRKQLLPIMTLVDSLAEGQPLR
jgi:2-polyprenyl-6-methoxyphenol hydroxylase-like FAD-dependent oxidoreductase